MVFAVVFNRHADEQRRQHGENEGLQERDKQFNQTHEQHKGNGHCRTTEAARYALTEVAEHKNQAVRLRTMMCPAVMFAKRRIIKAKGLVKMPKISIGMRMGFTKAGVPGAVRL